MSRTILTTALLCLPSLALSVSTTENKERMDIENDYVIGMKVLIITAGSAGLDALSERVLQSCGQPYEVLSLTEEVEFSYPDCSNRHHRNVQLCGTRGWNTTLGPVDLAYELYDSDTNNPKYNAIILTSDHLRFETVSGQTFDSQKEIALTQKAADELDKYCTKYRVRTAVLNSSPRLLNDEAIVPESNRVFATDARLMVSDNEIAKRIRNVVSDEAEIVLGDGINERSEHWITPARILLAENEDDHVVPVLDVAYPCDNDDSDEGTCRSAAALVMTDAHTSRETLHLFMSMGDISLHGVTLSHMLMPWLFKGLFFGERRVVLSTQVDDFEYGSSTTKNHCQTQQRQFARNLRALSHFQDRMNRDLPAGSNYTAELSLTGATMCDATVLDSVVDVAPAFIWVSANDDFEVDESDFEEKNKLASSIIGEGINADGRWSPLSLITPSLDDLSNTEAVEQLLKIGYRNVVGDRRSGGMTQSSITIIPRLPTRMYNNIGTPSELVQELNDIFGKDRDYYEIRKLAGYEVARNMLSLRKEPYKFLRANLQQASGRSLLTDWVESALEWVIMYTDFPVYTYKIDDLAEIYRQRERRDQCRIEGTIQYIEGRPVALDVTSKNECNAKITYTDTDGAYDFQPQQNNRRRQIVGGDTVLTLPLSGGGSSSTVRLSGAGDIDATLNVDPDTGDRVEAEPVDTGNENTTTISEDTTVTSTGATAPSTVTVGFPGADGQSSSATDAASRTSTSAESTTSEIIESESDTAVETLFLVPGARNATNNVTDGTASETSTVTTSTESSESSEGKITPEATGEVDGVKSGAGLSGGTPLGADSEAGTLTGAAIAGIVIGCLLVLVPLLALSVFICRRRRIERRESLVVKNNTFSARASDFVPFGPFDTHSSANFRAKNAA